MASSSRAHKYARLNAANRPVTDAPPAVTVTDTDENEDENKDENQDEKE